MHAMEGTALAGHFDHKMLTEPFWLKIDMLEYFSYKLPFY